VLSGSGLCNDTAFAHPLCEQGLSDSVVDFVCAGVVEVFPLEVDIGAVLFAQTVGAVEGRRAAYIVAHQPVELVHKIVIVDIAVKGFTEFFYIAVQYFGDICAPEASVIAVGVDRK